jgi:hypothetical protein
MIELSRTQDEEVGDGTTSVIVLGMHIFCDICFEEVDGYDEQQHCNLFALN